MADDKEKQRLKYILGGTEDAKASAEIISREKLAELIKLKLVIAKPDNPLAHLQSVLEDMNKRKRNMDCTDFVTSELQRLSVLPCDWMEEKEAKAIMGFFAMAMERGFPLSPTQQKYFDKLLKENFESGEAFAAAFGEWLVGAIQRSDQDPRFIPIIKAMIGNYYAVENMLTNDPTQWEQVIAATRSKLEAIAEKGEKEIFEEYDFDTKLGNLGKECFNCKVRLDDPCTGISKELWKEISIIGRRDMANMVFVSRSRQTISRKNENTCRKIEWTTESSACQI